MLSKVARVVGRSAGAGARAGRGAGLAGSRALATRTQLGDIFSPTPEHVQLRSTVREFAEKEVLPQALEHSREEKFNMGLFKKCGELGLLGITADPEFEGSGMDATAAVIVHEELSAADPSFTLSYLAHSMLFVNNLNFNGSAEQKGRFLPRACRGDLIGGMGMSEPSAGTDVLGMLTNAKRVAGGSGGYVLNGQKMWITNGAVSDTELGDAFLVYARTGKASNARTDFSLLLVEKGMPGFSLGQRIKDKCGMRASFTAELVFEDVAVPQANLVGKEGDAVLHMMRNLELERVALAAMSLGIARRSIEIMNKYAKERKAFGKSLNEFGQMQKHIADSYAEYAAGKAYVYNVARAMDLRVAGNRIDSDGTKLFCSTMAKNVADRAMQVLGGYGYCGPYQVEQLWRDAKLLEIGGGTLEAHEKNMTRDLSKIEAFP